MKYGFILVEGETEMGFVNEVLQPHLQSHGLFVTPQNLGGSIDYQNVHKDLRRLLKNSHIVLVSTMIDFYRFPRGFPGSKTIPQNRPVLAQVEHLEKPLLIISLMPVLSLIYPSMSLKVCYSVKLKQLLQNSLMPTKQKP
jgi:hypothetical protein